MDIWSHLIGGIRTSTPKKHVNSDIPQQRLRSFKSACNDLLKFWHNGDDVSIDAITAENIRIRLCRLLELLNDDTRGPTPHLCIAFAATSRVLVTVSKIAASFLNDGIIHEVLEICSLLIDCEEEEFLEDEGFANALIKLVDGVVSSGPLAGDIETESLMVEVLFSIASRTRLEPKILPTWFRPHNLRGDTDTSDSLRHGRGSVTRKEDFPLFYLLLHHVPHQGRAGEFARMGILYVIESASHSEDLEQWIVEGDMATLMASGLGALYSQLSRKLVLSYAKDEAPAILVYSNSRRPRPLSDAEETTSADYQAHLTTFLSYLVFWQDLLEHCTSTEIKNTLLDHFQVLFLQQLLYPSLLESSGVDGGSSVAVLTYLRHILESIEYPDLVQSILEYLLGSTKPPPEAKPASRPTALARRRKSQYLMETHARLHQDSSPDLFTLADLIITGLRCESQETIAATLQLSSILLSKHHRYAFSTLVKTTAINDTVRRRLLADYERDVDLLLSMAEGLIDDNSLEGSYEQHLHDARILLEHHNCSTSLLATPFISTSENIFNELQLSMPNSSKVTHPRMIVSDDPLLACLHTLIEHFFFNDVETNLSLTQTIIDLASCGLISLEGWLVTESANHLLVEVESASDRVESISGLVLDGMPPPSSPMKVEDDRNPNHTQLQTHSIRKLGDESLLFTAIQKLVHDVYSFHQDIQDFDRHLRERKQFLEDDVEGDGFASTSQGFLRRSEDSASSTLRSVQAVRQTGSAPDHPFFDKTSSNASRSSSPRGRQQTISTPSTLVSRLSRLQISPSRSSSQNTSTNYSPSPLRKASSMTSTLMHPAGIHKEPLTAMQRNIEIVNRAPAVTKNTGEPTGSENSSIRSSSIGPEARVNEAAKVKLGHLITNVIILQEFILELTAVIDVRATLFSEVRLD